jgi:hypothetical protein
MILNFKTVNRIAASNRNVMLALAHVRDHGCTGLRHRYIDARSTACSQQIFQTKRYIYIFKPPIAIYIYIYIYGGYGQCLNNLKIKFKQSQAAADATLF